MRLLICAGGTGGGVYPAIAVLKAVSKEADAILWVGGQNGIEAGIVQREGVPFESVPAAGVHGVGLSSLPGNILQLLKGTLASIRILSRFKPDVLFFTGGYVAVPMAVAGWATPSVLFVPDIEPGLALKVISRFARCIALTAENSASYFSGKKRLEVTGYPIRPDIGGWDKPSAFQKLNLKPGWPVLLFFGGSLGARSINRFVTGHLPDLLTRTQIVHISGSPDWEEVQNAQNSLKEDQRERYHPFEYLHEEMGAALASADLVISRAGASTLGEFPTFDLPAILIPYPHAWQYQKVNAGYLQENGGAILLPDQEINGRLLAIIIELLDNPQKLAEMRAKMHKLQYPQAALKIAGLIVETAQKGDRQ